MIKSITKHLYNHSDKYVLLATFLIAFTVYYYLNNENQLLLTIVGFGITIFISLRQYRIENDKMFKELFIMYNEKYDNKFNNCLNDIDKCVLENPNYELNEEQMQIVIDYLNLCAEEYLWHKKGRLDKTAWNSWERGMKYYLNISAIEKVIQNQNKQKDSYYGIFEYLKL
jgi:hypothetical protein